MAVKNIVVAITGASGSVLAKHALLHLFLQDVLVHLIISDMGRKIYKFEVEEDIEDTIQIGKNVILYKNDDLFAPIASGSFSVSGMIILPCSVSTASKIACGIGDTLINRAAACCIKEKVPIVISPRETPLTSIVLGNLQTLSENGVFIMPPVPSFYDKSHDYNKIINAMVGRMLSKIGVENSLYKRWSE